MPITHLLVLAQGDGSGPDDNNAQLTTISHSYNDFTAPVQSSPLQLYFETDGAQRLL